MELLDDVENLGRLLEGAWESLWTQSMEQDLGKGGEFQGAK